MGNSHDLFHVVADDGRDVEPSWVRLRVPGAGRRGFT
jgi:hypothetical protein